MKIESTSGISRIDYLIAVYSDHGVDHSVNEIKTVTSRLMNVNIYYN